MKKKHKKTLRKSIVDNLIRKIKNVFRGNDYRVPLYHLLNKYRTLIPARMMIEILANTGSNTKYAVLELEQEKCYEIEILF